MVELTGGIARAIPVRVQRGGPAPAGDGTRNSPLSSAGNTGRDLAAPMNEGHRSSNKLIIVCGLSFAGKSTLANAISAAFGYLQVDVDETKDELFGPGVDEIDAALKYAASAGLGIIAMKTMAGAYWDKERTKPINDSVEEVILSDRHL